MYAFWSEQISRSIEILKSGTEGLPEKEVVQRQKKYGKNLIGQKRTISSLELFFHQFQSPLIYILIIAALISLFVKEYVDAAVIFAAIFVNTLAGFVQEMKATQALKKLKEMVVYMVLVKRGGKKQRIASEELVPGDIVILQAGDKITFDGRLIEVSQLEVNEASLTGESEPVLKKTNIVPVKTGYSDQTNMVFMGTVVTSGHGIALVTQTGKQTRFGQVSEMLQDIKEDPTPLQLALGKLGNILGSIFLILSLFVFVIGIVYGREPFEMFVTSVALAVAAIPEGLLISLTVILTIGMQRILKRKAIVRRLLAAETLGSVNYICTDKTGTLTQGEMKAVMVWTSDTKFLSLHNARPHDKESLMPLIYNSFLCNEAVYDAKQKRFIYGSPTEKAIMDFALHQNVSTQEIQSWQRLFLEPFDSQKKWMGVVVSQKQERRSFVKGSPEVILKKCTYILRKGKSHPLSESEKKELKKILQEMTQQGLRVLAFAQKKFLQTKSKKFTDLTFTGFIGIKDPLRQETKYTLDICKRAGITPVVITGDHPLTAQAIGKELGLANSDHHILTGAELEELSDLQLKERIEHTYIYARVYPAQKVRIVQMLKSKGHVVAMIGDGVNDAPALKAADIGVALGSGTDVAKEIADIVLLNNNFKTIVNAVKQGRLMFENIRKVIVYLLAAGFTEIILIAGAIFLGLPLPITAAQILWINLVTDGFPHIALAFEEGDGAVMQEKPRRKEEPLINADMKILIFIIGLVTDVILFTLYLYLLAQNVDISYIRTLVFTAIGVNSLLYVYSIRNFRKNIIHTKIFNNKWLNISVFVGFFLLLCSLYIPFVRNAFALVHLGVFEWTLILCLGSIKLIGIELTKWLFLVKSHR